MEACRIFENKEKDAHGFGMYNKNACFISFRGTKSFKNLFEDIRILKEFVSFSTTKKKPRKLNNQTDHHSQNIQKSNCTADFTLHSKFVVLFFLHFPIAKCFAD